MHHKTHRALSSPPRRRFYGDDRRRRLRHHRRRRHHRHRTWCHLRNRHRRPAAVADDCPIAAGDVLRRPSASCARRASRDGDRLRHRCGDDGDVVGVAVAGAAVAGVAVGAAAVAAVGGAP